jgi:hypothetical protein
MKAANVRNRRCGRNLGNAVAGAACCAPTGKGKKGGEGVVLPGWRGLGEAGGEVGVIVFYRRGEIGFHFCAGG